MRAIATALTILGISLSGPAEAQTQPGVSGTLQLVVTCPNLIYVGAIQDRLPTGWLNIRQTNYVLESRSVDSVTMPGYQAPMIRCQYMTGGNMTEEIAAYQPATYPKCIVDANSNDKFVCQAINPNVVTTVVTP